MIFHRKIKLTRLAPTAHFNVLIRIAAVRHGFVQQVRNAGMDGVHLRLHFLEISLGLLQLFTDLGHFGHQWRDIFTFGLGLAYRLGAGVAQVLQVLRSGLQGFALLFQTGDFRHIKRIATAGQIGRSGLDFTTQVFRINHFR